MRKLSLVAFESLEFRRLFATVEVTNLNDSGAGSLRAAIAAATAGDTIDLTELSGTITLTSGVINLDKGLTFDGPGANTLSISGNDTGLVFAVSSAGLTMSDVSLTHGHYTNGGGALRLTGSANLTLNRCVLKDNHSNTSVGAAAYVGNGTTLTLNDCTVKDNTTGYQAGAISVSGTLNMTRCTISNNSVHAVADTMMHSGGYAQGGAIALFVGSATLTNCTIANNTAIADAYQSSQGTAVGGAIYAVNNGTSLSLINCTMTGNSASAGNTTGGGINASGTNVSLVNTIIAGNTATNHPDITANNITDGGYNLIGAYSGSGLVHGTNHNQVGSLASPLDAGLGTLADNGGFTETIALDPDSLAIDAGTSGGAPAADQRGIARLGATDIGAFEYIPPNTAPAFSSAPITDAGAGAQYTYFITATDGEDDDLTFDATTKPAWLSITDNHDGTATLSGTPDHADYGATDVTLTVSDGEETVEQSFTINVSVPRAVAEEDHTLHVNGTDGNDDIHVWIRQGSVRVTVNGVIRNFEMADVDAVEVMGFDGDDSVLVNVSTLPTTIFGGDGNDSLTGGSGDDSMVGGTGKDLLIGNEGADNLQGGGGKDRLVGGVGSDILYGQAGNDLLFGRDESGDLVSGGADNDSAETDDSDDASTLETLLA